MSHYESTPLAANQLWIPGENYALDDEYPTPTQDELRDLWQAYSEPQAVVAPIPGAFGAMRMPDAPPTAYVSLDICEVVRHTNVGIQAVERSGQHMLDNPQKSIHVYGEGCTYQENYADIQTLAQVLIEGDFIEPIDGIDQMRHMLQRWRRAGAYIMANTSTLPGCEPGTIRFFDRFLAGGFDAILLPRNHDSHASMPNKGDVAAITTLATEQAAFGDKTPSERLERPLTAIHIDDKPCHNVAFREKMTAIGAMACTLQPMYPSHHEADQQSIRTATPLQAFQVADAILRVETQTKP